MFPRVCHFEFNLSFLVKLAHHTYSSLFGTFLCNSASERKEHRVFEQTRSVWNFLKHHPQKFCNLLYTPPPTAGGNEEANVLWPRSELRDMLVWKDVYMSEQRQGSSAIGQQNSGITSWTWKTDVNLTDDVAVRGSSEFIDLVVDSKSLTES